MNLTTAINVFLRQSLHAGGFPFEVRLKQPNKETISAMLEAEQIAHYISAKLYYDPKILPMYVLFLEYSKTQKLPFLPS